jgi:hypothetical protein
VTNSTSITIKPGTLSLNHLFEIYWAVSRRGTKDHRRDTKGHRHAAMTAIDPKPPERSSETGHRNRLKLSFKTRQRGPSTFLDWTPYIRSRTAPAGGPPLWRPPSLRLDLSADPLLQSCPAFEIEQAPHLVAEPPRTAGAFLTVSPEIDSPPTSR